MNSAGIKKEQRAERRRVNGQVNAILEEEQRLFRMLTAEQREAYNHYAATHDTWHPPGLGIISTLDALLASLKRWMRFNGHLTMRKYRQYRCPDHPQYRQNGLPRKKCDLCWVHYWANRWDLCILSRATDTADYIPGNTVGFSLA